MEEYQLYTVLGIAAVGLVADGIMNYRNKKMIKKYTESVRQLSSAFSETFSQLNNSLDKLLGAQK